MKWLLLLVLLPTLPPNSKLVGPADYNVFMFDKRDDCMRNAAFNQKRLGANAKAICIKVEVAK